MSEETPTVKHFAVLYTSQKHKKVKTWHDGFLRYFTAYTKAVLYDEKQRQLDSTFQKSIPDVGDDMDFGGHLVTIESLIDQNNEDVTTDVKKARATQQGQQTALEIPLEGIPAGPNVITKRVRQSINVKVLPPPTIVIREPPKTTRKRASNSIKKNSASKLSESTDENSSTLEEVPSSTAATQNGNTNGKRNEAAGIIMNHLPVKRRRIGLSRSALASIPSSSTTLNNIDSNVFTTASYSMGDSSCGADQLSAGPSAPFKLCSRFKSGLITTFRHGGIFQKPVEFLSETQCDKIVREKKPLVRSCILPDRFMSADHYRDSLLALIYEHLNVSLAVIAQDFYRKVQLRELMSRSNEQDMETALREKGIGLHAKCRLGEPEFGFGIAGSFANNNNKNKYSENIKSVMQSVMVEDELHFTLRIPNKAHHSTYSKDDIWVISSSLKFEQSQTFIARSTFYGPLSCGGLSIKCLNPRDSSVSKTLFNSQTENLFALRAINASSELMMIDNLKGHLEKLPILGHLIDHKKWNLRGPKSSNNKRLKPPTMNPISHKTGNIMLTDEDSDIPALLDEWVQQYHLNQDQEKVLRALAHLIIRAPGFPPDNSNEGQEDPPVVLVHGIFGSGKSYLIAVLIMFIDRVLSMKQEVVDSEEEQQHQPYKILISSITNVAVDRILLELIKMGFKNFVRCGSLKRISKPILPWTAQTMTNNDEKLKELNNMLKDERIADVEIEYVKETIERFKNLQNRGLVHSAMVVGTTCMASTFEMLDDVRFSLAILDESSQISEPMALVPICRFECQKLLLVGDPQQLPPMLTTKSEKAIVRKGLDRTLFDRSVLMGIEPIMLRTQYRCHPKISAISNELFYHDKLRDGTIETLLEPVVSGLPTLCWIDVKGEEHQHASKSFYNDNEAKLIADLVKHLLCIGVKGDDIGIIALYKAQVSRLGEKLASNSTKLEQTVKISTVDAFQGAERNIIILSCVRTKSIGFSDNHERINVALTRARRHMLIFGDANFLQTSRCWERIIKNHCKKAKDGFLDNKAFSQRIPSFRLDKQLLGLEPSTDLGMMGIVEEDAFLDFDEEEIVTGVGEDESKLTAGQEVLIPNFVDDTDSINAIIQDLAIESVDFKINDLIENQNLHGSKTNQGIISAKFGQGTQNSQGTRKNQFISASQPYDKISQGSQVGFTDIFTENFYQGSRKGYDPIEREVDMLLENGKRGPSSFGAAQDRPNPLSGPSLFNVAFTNLPLASENIPKGNSKAVPEGSVFPMLPGHHEVGNDFINWVNLVKLADQTDTNFDIRKEPRLH